jgi:hypothetical protein
MPSSLAYLLAGCLLVVGGLAARASARTSAFAGIPIVDRRTLYPGETRIAAFQRVGADSLAIRFANLDGTATLSITGADGRRLIASRQGDRFVLAVGADTSLVELSTRVHPRAGLLRLTRVPGSAYRAAGRANLDAGTIHLLDTNLPIGGIDASLIADWIPPADTAGVPDELAALPRGSGPTSARLANVAEAYARWLVGREGFPSDRLFGATPSSTLRLLAQPGVRGWCSNLSTGFLALSARHGLPTRVVELGAPDQSQVWMGNHAANEVYDVEWRRWRLVDFTFGLLAVSDAHDRPLDVAALHGVLLAAGAEPSGLVLTRLDAARGVVRESWSELPDSLRALLRFNYGPRVLVSAARFPGVDGYPLPSGWSTRFGTARARHAMLDLPDQVRAIGPAEFRVWGNRATAVGAVLLLTGLVGVAARRGCARVA